MISIYKASSIVISIFVAASMTLSLSEIASAQIAPAAATAQDEIMTPAGVNAEALRVHSVSGELSAA